MSTYHSFWRERRAEPDSNRGPSAYQPNALPLGQIGSQRPACQRFKYISVLAVGFASVYWGSTQWGKKLCHPCTRSRLQLTSAQAQDRRRSGLDVHVPISVGGERRIVTTVAATQLVLLSIVCFIRLSSVDGRHCKSVFVLLVFGKCVQFCALFGCLVLVWFGLPCFALFCFAPFALQEGSWIDLDQLGFVEVFYLWHVHIVSLLGLALALLLLLCLSFLLCSR